MLEEWISVLSINYLEIPDTFPWNVFHANIYLNCVPERIELLLLSEKSKPEILYSFHYEGHLSKV